MLLKMRISAAFVEKAFHIFVHVSTLEKRPGEDGGEFILDGPRLRLRGYQPRRKLRSGVHCNSGDNRAQCGPAAACFQAARAKLEGRRKANVRNPAALVSSGQKGRDTAAGIFCVMQKEMVGERGRSNSSMRSAQKRRQTLKHIDGQLDVNSDRESTQPVIGTAMATLTVT